MMDPKCGCGEATYSGEGNENWWFVHGWGVHGHPLFCPRCADRLNADGSVTPKHEWIAEELELVARNCTYPENLHLFQAALDLRQAVLDKKWEAKT